jgi:hypothetical protein
MVDPFDARQRITVAGSDAPQRVARFYRHALLRAVGFCLGEGVVPGLCWRRIRCGRSVDVTGFAVVAGFVLSGDDESGVPASGAIL